MFFYKKRTKIRDSLEYSFWDGVFAQICFGIVDQFATPLALYLGANNAAIGILNFVRNALVSMVQAGSADITNVLKSRKKLITFSVFTAALFWLPAYFAPFLFGDLKVAAFIVLYGIASAFNMLPTPAWSSLMTEYIPYKKRGQYFGWRGTTLGIVYTFSVFAAGIFLNCFQQISVFWGFAVLMAAASLSRFASWYFLTKMYEPRWSVKPSDYFSIRDFIVRAPWSNFARFAISAGFLVFGVAIAAPFFGVFILQELKFGYLGYTVLVGGAVISSFVTLQYWGYFADKYGNMKIIRLCSLLISFIPLCWLLSSNFSYLFVLQLVAGFIWAGFNLCSVNFIYDVAVPAKRERCVAYFSFLQGMGLGIGGLFGGFIIQYLPAILGSAFFSLFVLSGAVRLVSAVAIRLMSKEVREVERVGRMRFLYDLSGIQQIRKFLSFFRIRRYRR